MYIQLFISSLIYCLILFYISLNISFVIYKNYLYKYKNTEFENEYKFLCISILFNISSILKYNESELICFVFTIPILYILLF